eukprot:jgi/Botrbrau1/2969/Bobra.0026s0036.1
MTTQKVHLRAVDGLSPRSTRALALGRIRICVLHKQLLGTSNEGKMQLRGSEFPSVSFRQYRKVVLSPAKRGRTCPAHDHSGLAALEALEGTIQVINRILSRRSSSSSRDGVDRRDEVKVKEHWISFGGKGSCSTTLDVQKSLGRSVREYLALPVSEYSLLDPKCISRDPSDDKLFCINLPLPFGEEAFGIRLEPRMWVEVDAGGEDGKVTFTSSRASLGNAELDTNFQLRMSSSLTGRGEAASPGALGRLKAWVVKPFQGGGVQPTSPTNLAPADAPSNDGHPNLPRGHIASEGERPADTEEARAPQMVPLSTPQTPFTTGADRTSGHSTASWDHREEGISEEQTQIEAVSRSHMRIVMLEECYNGPEAQSGSSSAREGDAAVVATSPSTGSVGPGPLPANGEGTWEPGSVSPPPETPGAGMPLTASNPAANELPEEGTGHAEPRVTLSGNMQGLSCVVDVSVRLNMPPPFTAVPAPVLGAAGSLIMKALLRSLLPTFIELLAEDYRRWAVAPSSAVKKPRQAVGSLTGNQAV